VHAHAGHAHPRPSGPGRIRALGVALGVTAAIAVFECAGGIAARSLALVSDSAHVAMDAVGLGIALAAQMQMRRPATARRSYGYGRIEILAAVANAALLLAVTVLIAIEAVRRFAAPQVPNGEIMLVVAAVGMLANLGLGLVLARGAHDDLSMRGALLHVGGDALGALAVVVGGLLVLALHRTWIDPALSLLVAALIVVGIVGILREATDVLLQSAPAHASVDVVSARLRALPGVEDVHDVHVWSLGSATHVLSTHVRLGDLRISEASRTLRAIESAMAEEFAIGHVTVQFECESCDAGVGGVVCTTPMRDRFKA